jgi:hypothetical protein
MSFLVARYTERDQILGNVIAQPTPRLQVMDLKIFRSPARLTTPAVPLQNCMAELAINRRFELQAWPFASNAGQRTT